MEAHDFAGTVTFVLARKFVILKGWEGPRITKPQLKKKDIGTPVPLKDQVGWDGAECCAHVALARARDDPRPLHL